MPFVLDGARTSVHDAAMGRTLSLALGALNGVVGDYLSRTGNGLATEMGFVHDGEPLPAVRGALEAALGRDGAAPRVVVLVHGLMCTEDVFRFPEGGGDYGSFLARDAGFTPFYVRYNTGLAIADNGRALSALLGALVAAYPAPLEEILLVGYSMGGLVLRGAFHVACLEGAPWLSLVERAIYVGTPHRGSPLERVGRVVSKVLEAIPDPYTRLIADLANLRSDGVKDLGDGDVRHEDRARGGATLSLRDPAHPVPLPPQIAHYLVAGSVSVEPLVARLFGDALVPLTSATDGTCQSLDEKVFPTPHIKILPGLDHVSLAHHPDVYAVIRGFLEEVS